MRPEYRLVFLFGGAVALIVAVLANRQAVAGRDQKQSGPRVLGGCVMFLAAMIGAFGVVVFLTLTFTS